MQISDEEFRRLSIKERYDSVAGSMYREKLKCAVEGRAFDLAKARSQAMAEYAAMAGSRSQPALPQVNSSVARSSAALAVAPPATASPASNPPSRAAPKKNEWEDDWDSFLNDSRYAVAAIYYIRILAPNVDGSEQQ